VSPARALLLLAVVIALGTVAPSVASAQAILSEGDAAELAQSLAEATEEQGICYGWSVYVSDQSGGPGGLESGSSGGPGSSLGTNITLDCTKSVELSGRVVYTCGSCESEDSSSVEIRSTFPGGPTVDDLEDLGLKGGQLKDDDGDVVLANMVGALPVIVASKGLADPVEPDPQQTPAATTDKPSGTPRTPDWLRESWLPLTICLLVIIGGACWFFSSFRRAPTTSPRSFSTEPPSGEDPTHG
jgi:hypothetical protein